MKLNQGIKRNQIRGNIYSRGLKERATKHEIIFMNKLKELNLWFRFQPFFLSKDKLYIPDFRLATQYEKLIVEIDGNSHKKRKDYDNKRTQWLKENKNCTVIRFSNREVENNINRVIARVLSYKPISNEKKLSWKSKLIKKYQLEKLSKKGGVF